MHTGSPALPLHIGSRAQVLSIVDKWVGEARYKRMDEFERKGRKEAAQNITSFLDDPSKTDLSLYACGLTSLPPIFHLPPFPTRLIKLALNGNHLTHLPKEIGQLAALTSLKVSMNDLEALPPEIGQLTLLTTLDVSDNELTTLPKEIGKCAALARLNVACTNLGTLPHKLSRLTALQFLDISHTQLLALPEWIGQLTALGTLRVAGNNLTVLPKEIGQLVALKTLDAYGNKLTTVPPEIANCGKLKKLDLDANNLTTLPDAICVLPLSELHIEKNPALMTPFSLVVLKLPQQCTVYVLKNDIPGAELEKLKKICTAPNYAGPQFLRRATQEEFWGGVGNALKQVLKEHNRNTPP
jgi:Leucine-rich repeat (LRR) protein